MLASQDTGRHHGLGLRGNPSAAEKGLMHTGALRGGVTMARVVCVYGIGTCEVLSPWHATGRQHKFRQVKARK